jgi:FkbM family methyltransferase
MIKAIAKKLLPESASQFIRWSRWKFGTSAMLRLVCANPGIFFKSAVPVRIPVPGSGFSVVIRAGTKDQSVFEQVFLLREYDMDFKDPRFILDAGAHIGLASVYFANRYPEAVIVALEPEDRNFDVLLKNIAAYPNIKALKAGLWNRSVTLKLQNPDAESWSFRMMESPDQNDGIPAVSVDDVLSRFELPRLDVLKMDIEGSEVEVLGASTTWIDKVRTLFIELHDRYRPGCRAAVDGVLAGGRFRESLLGENVVLDRIDG